MNQQQSRTLQQTRTTLAPAEVLAAAKRFFVRRLSIYAAFLEKEGPTFASFRGQGGEELIIGVAPVEGGTAVTGSTYLFDQQIARFFATLPPLEPAAAPDAPAPPAGAAA
ncbi:MAG: hypothetical protein ACJ79S_18505 [Gemmatimonadaceae bacterium]